MTDPGSPVPAGGAGADTGAVGGARIDEDDRAEVQNVSSQNDIPGVGTRAADGSMETDLDQSDADPAARPAHDDSGYAASVPPSGHSRVTDAATAAELPVEAYEPGVDPESARTSRLVGDDS